MRIDFETGKPCPSTLGEYRDQWADLVGTDNAAVRFLDDKIRDSPSARDEKVAAANSQMCFLLLSLLSRGEE